MRIAVFVVSGCCFQGLTPNQKPISGGFWLMVLQNQRHRPLFGLARTSFCCLIASEIQVTARADQTSFHARTNPPTAPSVAPQPGRTIAGIMVPAPHLGVTVQKPPPTSLLKTPSLPTGEGF